MTGFTMSMTALIESRTAEAAVWPTSGRIATVEVSGDLAAAEAVWRELEQPAHLSTAYQRFDFLGAWQRQVGRREGFSPYIVVARDADHRPLMLLPLALRHEHAVRTATFMGGKHTTFNMALWDRDFAATATAADLDALIAGLRTHATADVLAFHRQPERWHDLPNPMAMLPRQISVNACPLLTMTGADPATLISTSMRRRLRGKERKLQALPGYRYSIASDAAAITALLDDFFRVKPLRMAEQKLPNVFADPGVEPFIREACLAPLPGDGHAIDIHALQCDDEVIAIFAGVSDGSRFSMMFNTYTMSENARHSPGLILMRNIVDRYAGLGYRALDLGIGSDEYKRVFCPDDEPIFDSFIPLTSRGRLAATAISGLNRAKHIVKHNPALLQMAQMLRGAFR
jgi:CelD/BcsL family acetyltransferase involved in cellulose biosynthesis